MATDYVYPRWCPWKHPPWTWRKTSNGETSSLSLSAFFFSFFWKKGKEGEWEADERRKRLPFALGSRSGDPEARHCSDLPSNQPVVL